VNSSQTESVRIFIAIELPAELKKEITFVQQRLRPHFSRARVSWVKPDNIHLTLRFVGDVLSARIGELIRSCEEAKLKPAFGLHLHSIGFFPNARKPKVMWCGYENSEELNAVQRLVEDAVVKLRFPPEEKAFVPHLTMARIKEIGSKPAAPFYVDMASVEKEIRNIPLSVRHTVHEVRLIKSVLSPKGSEYTILHKWPLRN
jgi:2'-5' RNA ligase